MPLPTRPQRYCDPASLVFHNNDSGLECSFSKQRITCLGISVLLSLVVRITSRCLRVTWIAIRLTGRTTFRTGRRRPSPFYRLIVNEIRDLLIRILRIAASSGNGTFPKKPNIRHLKDLGTFHMHFLCCQFVPTFLCLSVYIFIYLSTFLYVYRFIFLSIYLSIYLSINLSIYQ